MPEHSFEIKKQCFPRDVALTYGGNKRVALSRSPAHHSSLIEIMHPWLQCDRIVEGTNAITNATCSFGKIAFDGDRHKHQESDYYDFSPHKK